MGTYVGATADVEQPLNSPGGEDFDVTRGTQRRSRGEPSIKDTKVYKSGQVRSPASLLVCWTARCVCMLPIVAATHGDTDTHGHAATHSNTL